MLESLRPIVSTLRLIASDRLTGTEADTVLTAASILEALPQAGPPPPTAPYMDLVEDHSTDNTGPPIE